MKPGARIALLFIFPVIAVAVCAAVMFSAPVKKPYTPERPQFLDYVERLGVTDASQRASMASEPIRNVFAYDDSGEEDQAEPEAAAPATAEPPADREDQPEDSLASYEPVWVSMIVDGGGSSSFSVINGRKMRIGDRAGAFTLTAIRKGSVTIRHTDGTEEIIHVKAF